MDKWFRIDVSVMTNVGYDDGQVERIIADRLNRDPNIRMVKVHTCEEETE